MESPASALYAVQLMKASRKIAESLGFEIEGEPELSAVPADKTGGFVTLVGSSTSLQVAIFSDGRGTQQLSRALMCMEPDEPDLDEDDVADALCEVANQLAGLMKRDLVAECPDIRIGLPLVVKGSLLKPHATRAETVRVMFGDLEVWLAAIAPKSRDGSSVKVA